MITAFDTNVLIYLLGHDSKFGPLARDVISDAIDHGGAMLSSVAVAEYLSHSAGDEKPLNDLLKLIVCVPVTQAVAIRAARIRRKQKAIKLPDALHVATALESHAGTFITNDKQLIKLGKIETLRITPLA